MRYVQLHTFYDRYLADFYEARPHLRTQPFQHQMRAILDDGFTATHLWGEHLEKLGFESHLLISNCPELQSSWAIEHGITQLETQDWQKEIVKKQIEILRPDILYICNPIDYDSKFLRTLSFRPPVIAGWRAQQIFDYNDFTEFDAILSSDPYSQSNALKAGAKRTFHFLPGFPEWIAESVKNEPKLYDVGFCGQITNDHIKRSQIIDQVSEYAINTKKFTPTFFVHQSNPYPFQHAGQFLKPSRWGLDMHREIKRTKVGLNVVIDFAKGEAGNMRQFEITGTGTFLLTEGNSKLSSQFELGTEIETYRTAQEMFEKIAYFSTHDAEREAIAARGHARCLKDHGMVPRSIAFAEILKELLQRNGKSAAFFPPSPKTPATTATKPSVEAITTPGYGVSVQRAEYFSSLGLIGEALFILDELLKREPQNSKALTLKSDLSKTGSSSAFNLPLPQGNHVLIYGIHRHDLLNTLLDALQVPSAPTKKITILIDRDGAGGEPLGTFEAECNQLISQKRLWSSVILLRGNLSKASNQYANQFASVDEVYFTAGTMLPPALPQRCLQRPL